MLLQLLQHHEGLFAAILGHFLAPSAQNWCTLAALSAASKHLRSIIVGLPIYVHRIKYNSVLKDLSFNYIVIDSISLTERCSCGIARIMCPYLVRGTYAYVHNHDELITLKSTELLPGYGRYIYFTSSSYRGQSGLDTCLSFDDYKRMVIPHRDDLPLWIIKYDKIIINLVRE
jgi:hypothetical protein